MTAQRTMQMIDELGRLKAKVAELTRRERELKDELIGEIGEGASAEGRVFRATIVGADQHQLDMDAVRAKLSPQFIAAHTNVVHHVTVRVVARVRDVKKVA